MALAVVLLFTAASHRSFWQVITVSLIMSYAGLSVYTAYMRDRTAIRASVWGGAPLSDRMDTFRATLASVEGFDVRNSVHLELVDGRLNQNILVGAAVNYLASTEDFAKGETLKLAILAMIPRLVWPDKPISAGSAGMVTRFTGIEFARGTSVGIGPVMELYANYGTPCVVIGFLLLGMALGVIDVTCARRLAAGRWHAFALWFLVGISFLQVGGAFAEVSMSAVASVVVGTITTTLLAQYERVVDRNAPGKLVDQAYTWRS
jgi:hypothetical protein